MSTHIGAAPGQVADTVLLPGDPLRAQWIAQTYLRDVECYSSVRNMLGFTGTYGDRRISVQGTGMGHPSLAIYATELMADYGVRTLVRVGSCGALSERLAVRDVVLAITASTDSAMNRIRFEGFDYAPAADFGLLRTAADVARERELPIHVAGVASIDSFYSDRPELLLRLADYGVVAVDMETNMLYTLAAKFDARALTVLTVSDHIRTGEATTAQERERTFTAMAELALETVTA
ncbi:purine-nucleoside phosphorylase [Actinopolymorpha pittospori]|uniref:Uridine phosphorylase n=1 Tax=Actinopolymorpha pittospori TaxID=648752 RepID=A0A927N7N2_9ACTN|nr:purine-nucleoside phosphorylase [Actinopolymorpha pittospori]MBE1611728.1 purine-nucleoside phosphorylase [Actinopolymorpha pittospori]